MMYKGYSLRLDAAGHIVVSVRRERAYTAKTLDQAKRWINAYREGVYWATAAKLEQDKGTRK